MKISILNSKSFFGRNLFENLKNIQLGKNRTRPNLSITDIYLDEIGYANVVIAFDNKNAIADLSKIKKLINISKMNINDSESDCNIINGDDVLAYRIPQIVGKWQGLDSAIAYLCNAVANDLSYEVKDRNEIIEVLFIDDLIDEIFDALEGHPHKCDYPTEGSFSGDITTQWDGLTPIPNENGQYCYCPKTHKVSIGSIIDYLESFKKLNKSYLIPEIPKDSFIYKLYSMYLSYLPKDKMAYPLKMNIDERGNFTELIKTTNNGQVSINIARPGNIRGQHWHNTKWEIFIVVSGHGLIQQRKIGINPETGKEYEKYEFEVRGEEMKAVIMVPGYAHNIINLEKDRDLVTVMWANESFDPQHPDTFREEV